ncbi:hypothetical protein DFH27DRAFT_617115 [Peziza echinospora]|nr:hypothetical protein DFH27DRAFT_617115 [Peziza echinospora]
MADEIVEFIIYRFLRGPKSMGNVDPNSASKINGAFLCFVASVIQHSPKAWRSGTLDNPLEEYRASRSSRAHQRILATWALYPARIGKLMIGVVKNKLDNLVIKEHGVADEEPIAPAALHTGDHEALEKFLEAQLQEQIDKHKVRMHRNRRIVDGSQAEHGENTQLQQMIASDQQDEDDLPSSTETVPTECDPTDVNDESDLSSAPSDAK